MKKNKFGIAWFLAVVAGGLLAAVCVVVVIDPFFQYHAPLKNCNYIIDNQLSQNPGMAKNFTYDSVILGSSMTVNFNPEVFQDEMGLNAIKLSYNGAYPKDQDNILKIVETTHPDVKAIILGIDVMSYSANPEETKYPVPEYLYDNNVFNDVSYWFNKDVWFNYILKPMFSGESTKISDVYYSWPYLTFSRESALSNYKPPTSKAAELPYDEYEERVTYNMKNYIIPHIEASPNATFYVFFPPYSMIYWYDQIQNGDLEAEMYQYETIIKMLLPYKNVKVFYFQNQYDYISDLDHYADYYHYEQGMNDLMVSYFAEGKYQVTADNYLQILSEMKDYIKAYDYSEIADYYKSNN